MIKMYYETQDYNGMLVTDGENAYDVAFPMDGTENDAKNFDTSNIDGCENFEEVQNCMGINIELFPFNEKEFEKLIIIGEL